MRGPNHGNQVFGVTDAQIRAVCSYMTDAAIASHFHIAVDRVRKVRGAISQPRRKSTEQAEVGTDAIDKSRLAADGRNLHRAMWAVYQRIAKERGLADEYEAMVLCGMAA